MEPFTTDDLLTALNPLGKIQILFLVTSTYLNLLTPLHSQSVNFLAATPEHHCSPRPGYFANESLPTLDGEDSSGPGGYAECSEYIDPDNGTETQRCQNGWVFRKNIYGETIISEWDLVCGQNAAAEVSQVIFQTGGLTGSLLFGALADRYGRRPSFLFGLVLFNVSGLALCASVSYVMFVVIRFLNGLAQMATWIPLSGNLSEYMIPKYRGRAMAVPGVAYTFGLLLMVLLAFLVRDWRYLQLALIAPMVVGSFAMWFLPESLRWLMSKGKDEKAEVLVRRLSKINGVDSVEGFYDSGNPKVNPKSLDSVYTISGGTTIHDRAHQTSGDPKLWSRNDDQELSTEAAANNPAVPGVCSVDNDRNMFFVVGDSPPPKSDSLNENQGIPSVGTVARTSHVKGVGESPKSPSLEAAGVPSPNPGTVKESPEMVGVATGCNDFADAADDLSTEKSTYPSKDAIDGRATWSDLFKRPVLHVTLVLSVSRFAYTIVYFGFALSTGRLAGNPYLNFFFSAVVELPARLLATVIYKRIRRTYLLSLCFSACFIGLGIVLILPSETKNGVDLSIVRSVMSLCGKFFVTLTLAGQLLLVMELYPTTMRNMGHGWTTCMGRCGAIVAPFMLYLDKVIWNFSGILMAAMSLVTAVVVLTLPDTRRVAQPQSTADLTHIMAGTRRRKKKGEEEETPPLEPMENKGFEPD